jgi:hypothetical protein
MKIEDWLLGFTVSAIQHERNFIAFSGYAQDGVSVDFFCFFLMSMLLFGAVCLISNFLTIFSYWPCLKHDRPKTVISYSCLGILVVLFDGITMPPTTFVVDSKGFFIIFDAIFVFIGYHGITVFIYSVVKAFVDQIRYVIENGLP